MASLRRRLVVVFLLSVVLLVGSFVMGGVGEGALWRAQVGLVGIAGSSGLGLVMVRLK